MEIKSHNGIALFFSLKTKYQNKLDLVLIMCKDLHCEPPNNSIDIVMKRAVILSIWLTMLRFLCKENISLEGYVQMNAKCFFYYYYLAWL